MLLHLRNTHTIEVWARDRRVGLLRYKWISPGTVHVMSLVTRVPWAIWALKRQLYALPWQQVMFHRRTRMHQQHPQPWRFHFRRPQHVRV